MNPSLDVQVRRTPARLNLSTSRLWIGIIAIAVLGVFLVWLSRPWILWAYNLQQAGALQSAAITYAEPRYSDSLPVERDAAANDAALAHLAAAIQWRPDDAYAYRLAADSYLAKGNWTEAIAILQQAQTHAGDDTLIAWKRVLAYEQLYTLAQRAPDQKLISAFTTATPDTPRVSVKTPYCTSASIASCYVGRASFQLPVIGSVYTGTVEADTVFIHPPARITAPVTLPAGQPALSFMLGLDPQAYDWGTDGATFQAWVVEADGGIIPVYERFVTAEQLQQGWTPDWIDLTPWAGQTIQLTIGTDAGPQGRNTGDWVGWGNVVVTNAASAAAATMDTEGQIRTALAASEIDATELLARGDEANSERRYDEAQVWYHRAELTGAVITSTLAYAKYIQVQEADGFTAGLPYLELAVNADVGWSHPSRRFNAFFAYGRYLTSEEKDYVRGSQVLQGALASLPGDLTTAGNSAGEAHWWMAVALRGLKDNAGALPYAETAARLITDQFNIQVLYGFLIYENDPTQLGKVEDILKRALSLEQRVANWRSVISFWLENDQETLAFTYCQQALTEFSAEDLGNICWSGDSTSSSIAYRDYLASIRDGKPEAAYDKLAEATSTDAGWLSDNERFRAWEAWSLYLYDNSDYERAIPALERAISLLSSDVRTWGQSRLYANLGRAYTATQRYADARPMFEQALAIVPDAFVYFDYGTVLYQLDPQSLQPVDNAFKEAVDKASKPADMRASVITFWYEMEERATAEAWCTTGADEAAIETLCTNGATDTSGDQYREYLALKTDQPEAANDLLEAAITQDTGWQQLTFRFQAWRAWGDLLFTTGEYTAAIEAANTAIDAKDFKVTSPMLSEVYRLLGLSYVGNEDNSEGITAFQTAISLNASNVWAYIHYGKALYTEEPDQLEKVTELLKTAITLAPNDVGVWQSVLGFWQQYQYTDTFVEFCSLANESMLDALDGYCWAGDGVPSRESFEEYRQALRTGEVDQAYAALEQAITVDGGWRNADERFDAWLLWSRRVVQQGDTDQIIEVVERTLSLATESALPAELSELNLALARSYSIGGDFDRAVTYAQQAVDANNTDVWAHVYLGEYTYRQDNNALATTRQEFEQALDLAGDIVLPWQYVLAFWWELDQPAEVTTLCANAPASVLTDIEIQCWDGNGVPSEQLYTQYLTALQDGNETQAYEALQTAIDTDSGWATKSQRYVGWRKWVMYLWEESQYEDTIVVFEKVIEIAPESTSAREMSETYRYYGLSLWSVNRQQEAMAALAQAVEEDDTSVWAHLHYGKYLYSFQGGNSPEVELDINRALELAGNDLAIWQNVIAFWMEHAEYSQVQNTCTKVPDAIKEDVSFACWESGDTPSAVYYATYREQLQADNKEAAYQALEQAITVNGGWNSIRERFSAWNFWAHYVFDAGGRDAEALEAFKTLVAVAPPTADPKELSEPYRYLGIAYVNVGDNENGIPALRTAVEYDPNNIWAHIHYGKFSYWADDGASRDLTIQQFDLALALANNDAKIWENLIQFWISVGDAPEAQVLCDKAAAIPEIAAIASCPAVQ